MFKIELPWDGYRSQCVVLCAWVGIRLWEEILLSRSLSHSFTKWHAKGRLKCLFFPHVHVDFTLEWVTASVLIKLC